MVLRGRRQVDEDRAAELRRVGLAGGGAVDVQRCRWRSASSGRLHRSSKAATAGGGRRLARPGRGEGVELQSADVGPPPFLVARRSGQGTAWNRANASRRRSTSHAGSSRPFEERLEGVLGEAAGGGDRCRSRCSLAVGLDLDALGSQRIHRTSDRSARSSAGVLTCPLCSEIDVFDQVPGRVGRRRPGSAESVGTDIESAITPRWVPSRSLALSNARRGPRGRDLDRDRNGSTSTCGRSSETRSRIGSHPGHEPAARDHPQQMVRRSGDPRHDLEVADLGEPHDASAPVVVESERRSTTLPPASMSAFK